MALKRKKNEDGQKDSYLNEYFANADSMYEMGKRQISLVNAPEEHQGRYVPSP